jgi:hypothetical protein
MIKRSVCLIFALVMLSSIVVAQDYSLDIKITQMGDNVTYNVLLLKDSIQIRDSVQVSISDINNQKVFNYVVFSGEDNLFNVQKDFPSGNWQIKASYQGKEVTRLFSVIERQEAKFSLDGDNLIISNTGNAPYTETVKILIGDKEISQKQNIDLGGYRQIKLVAPNGKYNVQVSVNGITQISKQDVELTGTGDVIGALNQQLIDNQPTLGSARDVKGESILSSKNFSIAVVFIGAVFGLFVLILVERVMRKKRASQAKDMIGLH